MSATTLERQTEHEGTEWFVMDESIDVVIADQDQSSDSLADRWTIEDPVDELLVLLNEAGRAPEAHLIAKVLGGSDERELDRMFLIKMQESLAEDWDSPEDDYYDTL